MKDAQAQLRHYRASTTLDIYQQFVAESQRRAVDRLSRLAPIGNKTNDPETAELLKDMVARDGSQSKYTPYVDLSFPLSKTLPESLSASD